MIGPTGHGKAYLSAQLVDRLRRGPRTRWVLLVDRKHIEALPPNVVAGQVVTDSGELEAGAAGDEDPAAVFAIFDAAAAAGQLGRTAPPGELEAPRDV